MFVHTCRMTSFSLSRRKQRQLGYQQGSLLAATFRPPRSSTGLPWTCILAPLLLGEAQADYYALWLAKTEKHGLRWSVPHQRGDRLPSMGLPAWSHPLVADGQPAVDHQKIAAARPTYPLVVVKRVAMDRFLRALPVEEQKTVGMRFPKTPWEMTEALECALIALDLGSAAPQWSFPNHRPGRNPYGEGKEDRSLNKT